MAARMGGRKPCRFGSAVPGFPPRSSRRPVWKRARRFLQTERTEANMATLTGIPPAILRGIAPLRTTPAEDASSVFRTHITVTAIQRRPDGSQYLAVTTGNVGLRAWLPPGSPPVEHGKAYTIEQPRDAHPILDPFIAIYPARPEQPITTTQDRKHAMNALQVFNFQNHNLRIQQGETGEPWFHAADVCEALELGNPRQALDSHVEKDDVQKMDTIDSMGRTQRVSYVNESGLYALIFGCKKEAAKKFKHWVTSEVLPSIRKTGSYTQAPQAQPAKQLAASTKDFRALFGIARLIGLDRNAAAISANQAVAKAQGVNLLADRQSKAPDTTP